MRKFLPSPQLCCLIALALTAQTALLEAAEPADAPVQTTEQFYPSVDGGQVHCYPNFTDSPRGKETRERLLTRGPKVDLATLVGLGSSASPAQVSEFQKQMEEQRTNDWAYLCRYRQDNARIIASGHSPEAVFIGDSLTENWPAAGTNDVNGARGPATQDDVLNNIKAMVAMARANHIAVVLASIPPIDPSSRKPGFNPDPSVVALNHRMRELAHQWHLVFVDYYTVLTDGHGNLRQTLANDGLHPNRAGYDLMEPLTRRAIAQAEASPAS